MGGVLRGVCVVVECEGHVCGWSVKGRVSGCGVCEGHVCGYGVLRDMCVGGVLRDMCVGVEF